MSLYKYPIRKHEKNNCRKTICYSFEVHEILLFLEKKNVDIPEFIRDAINSHIESTGAKDELEKLKRVSNE